MKLRFFKRSWLALIMMALILTFGACQNNNTASIDESKKETEAAADSEKETETTAESETTQQSAKEVPETDREGYEITVPEEINTIISLAPSNSEILIELGLGDKIIGVDTNTQGMELLSADLPAFDMQSLDAEQLLALEPDVIFISGMSYFTGDDSINLLKDNGICIISIPTSESIDAIKEDIRFIAAVTATDAEGEEIVSEMEKEIDEIAAIGAAITEKKTVYFEISPSPYLYSFGKNVFLQEMLEIIGAVNIFEDQEGWLSVNAEDVVAANPDVILSSVIYDGDPVPEILSREGFSEITAVTNEDVYYIDNNASSIPSQNIVTALRQMAEAVYPEYYK